MSSQTVVVHVAEIGAHARNVRARLRIGNAGLQRHFLKLLAAEIVKQHVGRIVVGHEHVHESIVVVVGERHTHALSADLRRCRSRPIHP